MILTGVIQDSDKEIARKWPILGDLPLLAHFWSTDSERQKNELVILVTPSIIDDNAGGAYGYEPGTSAGRDLVQAGS